MAEAPTFFSGLVGGVMGAVAATDYPGATGTDWTHATSKLFESGRDLEGCVHQLTFIVGKVAQALRAGAEHLLAAAAEGRAPTGACAALMDKANVDQSLDAGKQGAELLVRGAKALVEAVVEGGKVAAVRGLIFVEHAKEVVVRNIPTAQEKVATAYNSFMRGYAASPVSRSLGYAAPSYTAPSYGAPPPSQPPTGFFW